MEKKFLSTLSKLVGGGHSASGQARPATITADTAAPGQTGPTSKIAYLTAMRIFRDLPPEEMKRIEAATVMTTALKGKTIYSPGKTGEVLFLLKKGTVHLYRLSSEGRKFIVQTVAPMTFFGQMTSVGQNMQDLFAEAAEECLVCVLGKADVERLILSKPQVALRMMEEIGQRMQHLQERLGDSAFKGIPARAASLLLKLSNDGEQLIKGLTHQDLADMLGIYRETVTNALDDLRDDGLIEIGRKEISILDREKLREVAEEELLRRR